MSERTPIKAADRTIQQGRASAGPGPVMNTPSGSDARGVA